MNASNVLPAITLEWQRGGVAQPFPFVATARPFGSFPVGVWGPPQDSNNRKIPKAEMIEALNELDLVCRADESPGGPEIPYYQVEIGVRKPLPFTRRSVDAAKVKTQAKSVTALVTQPVSVSAAFAAASTFLAATATPTTLAALRGERQSPPLLGTLTEGIEQDGITMIPGIGQTQPQKVYDHFIDAPVAVGLLSGATTGLRVASTARTTVKGSATAWRVAPPTLASVEAGRSRSIAARLVVTDAPAVSTGTRGTLIGADVPPTAVAHAGTAVVARTGASGAEHLSSFTAGLAVTTQRKSAPRAARGTAGATLMPGEIVVLKMPNAHADTALEGDRPQLGVAGAPARVVLLGHGGLVLADRVFSGDAIEIARGTERIVAVGQGTQEGSNLNAGLDGWHAGHSMPYAGWSTAVASGCVVRSTSDPLTLHRERLDAGWVTGAELARGVTTVTTTFAAAPRTVVIVLDDPAAFGDTVGGRALLLGLDGAARARGASGQERPPVLLAMENRSVLAYDIVPEGNRPVVVTIASETGWSLVGVMGSAQLDSAGAIALISARGLDTAIQPLASKSTTVGEESVLRWLGPTRTSRERQVAKLRAGALPLVPGAKAESPQGEVKSRPKGEVKGRPKSRPKSRPKLRTAKRVTATSKTKSGSKGRKATSRSKTKKGGRR
jgi:hypothetical protein